MVLQPFPSSYQKGSGDSYVIDLPDRNGNVASNKENTMDSMTTPLLQTEGSWNSDAESIGDNSIRSTHSIHSIQSGLPLHSMHPLPGMEIRCHQIRKNADLSPCSQHDALAGAKTGKKHYWVDIDADPHHASELRAWLQKLNLPNYVIDVLANTPDMWASQIIPLQGASLAVIRILPEQADSDEIAHLAALLMRNMLITFTSRRCRLANIATSSTTMMPVAATEVDDDETPLLMASSSTTSNGGGGGGLYALSLAHLKQKERLPAATSGGALLAWLRFHLDRMSSATRELRYTVLAMDEAMDREITSVELREIIDTKDQVLRLLSVSEEQTACLEALVAANTTEGLDTSSSSLKGALSILLATAQATERMTLRLEKHVIDLRQRCEDLEHVKINRRLGVLTAVSAIFLPLTLLAGIWGMNFHEMPELDKPYSYPAALGFMVFLALSMLCYLRRSGWFDH